MSNKNNQAITNSYTGGVTNRRKRALARLEAQLKSGSPLLSDRDKERIEKEIATLKERI